MTASHDLIDSSLTTETISELRACWERWNAAVPHEAGERPLAAAYLRCDPTAPGTLVKQLDEVLRALSESGYFVPWDLIAAEAVGGYKREHREKLQGLMGLVPARRFVSLGVIDVSRLGRNLRQVVRLIEGLLDDGVDLTMPGRASLRRDGYFLVTLKLMSEMLEVAQLRDRETASHRRRLL